MYDVRVCCIRVDKGKISFFFLTDKIYIVPQGHCQLEEGEPNVIAILLFVDSMFVLNML